MSDRPNDEAPPASDQEEEITLEAPEPPEATHQAEDETWETEGNDAPHLEEEVQVLRARVAELEQEAQGLKDRWLRARADYDNLTRRTDTERDQLTLRVTGKVVEQLLEPLDVLARAAADAEGVQDPHAQGIRMTHRSLWQALERQGLEEVPGEGAPFDVQMHEAVATEPSEEPEGTIVQVVRPGYRLHGKLLRPALVKVSAGPAEKA